MKGGAVRQLYPGAELLKEAQKYASHVRKGERLIPITEQTGTNILRKYARLAGVPQWDRLHNHRQRAFFGTLWTRRTGRDPWKLKSLMGHKDLRATAPYVEDLTPEEERELLDSGIKS